MKNNIDCIKIEDNLKNNLNIKLAILYTKNLYDYGILSKQEYDNVKKYIKRKYNISI